MRRSSAIATSGRWRPSSARHGWVNGLDWDARGSRRYIRTSVEASLRRLGTDRIDLLQMHEPDPATPIDESLAALDELVHAGKVLYLGSSQFAGWQVVDAEWSARTRADEPVREHAGEVQRDRPGCGGELIPACLEVGVGLLPFFPLEHGLLTGKYHRGDPAPAAAGWLGRPTASCSRRPWDRIEAVTDFARSAVEAARRARGPRGATGRRVGHRGATTPEQVVANALRGVVPDGGRPRRARPHHRPLTRPR